MIQGICLAQKEGFGVVKFGNGEKFMGNFVKGMAHGHGTYYKRNGEKVMGLWENGEYKNHMILL